VRARPRLAWITALALGWAAGCVLMALVAARERAAAERSAALLSAGAPTHRPSAAATPTAGPAAAPRRLEVVWTDPGDRSFRSRIDLDDRGGARVTTSLEDRPLVSYRATVRADPDGTIIVDATAAATSGPAARDWAPDTFRIRSDGGVEVHDGTHAPCAGYLAQDSTHRAR
jgi:hypothetical protein